MEKAVKRKRKIIMDCDPGHDDAVAIMLAARNPGIELLGITTVRGNQTIEKVTRNALNICQYLDIDVPVCQGLGESIVRQSPPVESRVHGESGLDGPAFDTLKKQADPRHAVDFIIETVLGADSPVTFVATGPLSNVAMAMKREPRILSNIEEIVIMGGSYGSGNVTPAAEFNIIADAEAAYVVFNCGRPVVMMGLDVTRQALCYPSIVERMEKNAPTKAGKLFTDMMRFFCMTQKKVYGWEGGPLHDPTTIAYLIDPGCFEVNHCYTQVDISEGPSRGRTNCDIFHLTDKPANSYVALKLDTDRFWDIVEEELNRYEKAC